MATYKVAWNQITRVATVLNAATAIPSGSVFLGNFEHDSNPFDGQGDDTNHRLYHHVRDIFYRTRNIQDMHRIKIISMINGAPVEVAAPTFTTDPSISGIAKVGQTLTGNDGVISNGTVSARSWFRNGNPIAGATTKTYLQTSSDLNALIAYEVTATGAGGNTTKRSNTVGPVAPEIAAATRLLASASRTFSPIDGVMGTLPTISQGADFAASLVNPTMTISYGSGMYQANDLAVIESVSGKIVLGPSGNQYQGQGMTGNRSTLAKRGQSGQGLRFMTSAVDMDFCMNLSAANFVIYVTDVATGVRARASDGDITFGSSNWRYVRLTFATRASRIIEVYTTNLGAFRGINCEAGYTITKAPASTEAKITILGDSWANGQLSGGTKSVKLNWATYFAERFGVLNPNQSANGGTGLLNPGGTNGTYRERVLAGDIDVAFIGEQDLIAIETSVNDTNFTAVDADCQTEMQLLTAEVMARQPNAVIIAWGPQTTLGTTTPQSRHDAIKAGFLAAAGSNKRCIWIDSSPAGQGWFANATERAAWIGTDNTHPNDLGKIGYGRRAGNASVAAVQAIVG